MSGKPVPHGVIHAKDVDIDELIAANPCAVVCFKKIMFALYYHTWVLIVITYV